MPLRLLSYNCAGRFAAWDAIAACDVDVALLQETPRAPAWVAEQGRISGRPWEDRADDPWVVWKASVVRMSDRVHVEWLRPHVAVVTPPDAAPIIVMSMYGQWRRPHPITRSSWIIADGSVHRLISDLSEYIGAEKGHRIIAAGDLNILHGYGEHGSAFFAERYLTIFRRMEVLGLRFVGPQHPNGRQAEPWPAEMPAESLNVPTFYRTGTTPSKATRQLDFVFASESIAPLLHVRALNGVEEWGPSDHCRVVVEFTGE